jgi:hypothetical protein
MLPTLHLWQLMRTTPISSEFRKLLHFDKHDKTAWWWNALINIALLIMLVPMLFALPVIVSLLCLPKAIEIADIVARQYRSGRHDAIAVTLIGDMGLLLGIIRICFQSMATPLTGLFKVWVIATGGALLMFLISGVNVSSTLHGTIILSLIIGALFIDYAQCVVLTAVIGILAGLSRDPFKARSFAFIGYFSIQFLLYGVMAAAMIVMFVQLMMHRPIEQALFLFGAALATFFAAREGIIAVIWRQIRQRLNDDIPTFNISVQPR